ncbi:DUF5343 domain-containing protein [Fodinibius saliphilus]|uniref:DUF5343 domain-containing protein n=1 Tax=Fodinibius saliphilus TaxID=1920650 RepID=UPI001BB1B24A|nr:DUF5343 domain-containing protein [Fodinibius saliphilus]
MELTNIKGMKVSEAFLVNTKNFDTIINALATYDADDIVIDSDLLERLGYSDPNDLLVIRLLKDLNIINNDGKPSTHFKEFQNPETTNLALAKGLTTAYEDIFNNYPKLYQSKPDEINNAFLEVFKNHKTELIIKYISNTFYKMVNYVGVSTITKALNEDTDEDSQPVESEAAVLTQNGSYRTKNLPSGETIGKSDVEDIINRLAGSHNTIEANIPKEGKADSISEQTETPTPAQSVSENQEDPEPFEESSEKKEKDDTKDSNSQNIDDKNPIDLNIPLNETERTEISTKNSTSKQKFVQKALLRKSDLLFKMKRWEQLIPTLEEIINRYDTKKYPTLKKEVSKTIMRRAISLLKLNRNEKALPALDQVINRFKDSDNPELYNQASHAMLHKVQLLEKTGNSKELLPLYNTIVNRLNDSSEIQMLEKLDDIYLKRFDLILESNNEDEILDASSKLIDRFKGSGKHTDYIQKAMIKRAEMLDNMNRDEEALKAYNQFLGMFG